MSRKQTTRRAIDTGAELVNEKLTSAAKATAHTAEEAVTWATWYIHSQIVKRQSRPALYTIFDSLAEETAAYIPYNGSSVYADWVIIPGRENHLFPTYDPDFPQHKLRLGVHGHRIDDDGKYIWLPETYLAAERAEGPLGVTTAPVRPARLGHNHWVGAEFVRREDLANMTPEKAITQLLAFSMNLGAYVINRETIDQPS